LDFEAGKKSEKHDLKEQIQTRISFFRAKMPQIQFPFRCNDHLPDSRNVVDSRQIYRRNKQGSAIVFVQVFIMRINGVVSLPLVKFENRIEQSTFLADKAFGSQ
jgi:hypothetical protein